MGQLAPVPDQAPLIPPQHLEAEESVLGAAMMSPGAIDACREIIRDDGSEFYRESHARIWRAIVRLRDRGEPLDVITLTDDLEQHNELDDIGGRVRLYELAAIVPASSNASHYARIIAEQARRRDLIRVGAMISRLGWEGAGEVDTLLEQARTIAADLDQSLTGSPLDVETWAQFERTATETIPMLIEGLWPETGLGFIAAPPKKGKTWIALSLAASVATGKRFLATFEVTKPEPVVYLALEGHRSAIRGRIGALANGLQVDPHTDDLLRRNLHIAYKPAGLNLADPVWIRTVRDLIQQTAARLLIVDVLRAAAIMKENSNDEFGALVRALQPLQQAGCAIAILHHFGKLTEVSKDRTPGERMSGAGAMYGAFDVGVFITKSDQGARELRVEFETRDVVAPEPVGLHLTGTATGTAGGFVFSDAATWAVLDEAPEPEEMKAPAAEIADYIIEQGGEADRADVEAYFQISRDTLSRRVLRLWSEHRIELVVGRGRGAKSRFIHRPETVESEQLDLTTESHALSHAPKGADASLNGVRDFTPTKTLENALVTKAAESHDPDDLSLTEYADLQGKFSHESSASPTERQAPATAEPATPIPDSTTDDIVWTHQ